MDIRDYNNEPGIIQYLLFTVLFDYKSFRKKEGIKPDSLSPQNDTQKSFRLDTDDPFQYFIEKWSEYKEDKQNTINEDIKKKLKDGPTFIDRVNYTNNTDFEKKEFEKLAKRFYRSNNLEKKVYLLKYFMFISRSNKMNINNQQINDWTYWNVKLNGAWNKYDRYVEEPPFNINHPELCSKYIFYRTTGNGSTSRVIEAKYKQNEQKRISIKIIPKTMNSKIEYKLYKINKRPMDDISDFDEKEEKKNDDTDNLQQKTYKNEVDILSQLDHKNIIKFSENTEDNLNYYILTNYYEGPDLFHCVKTEQIKKDNAPNIIKQILLILKYLHSQKIAALDLKCEDFVFTKDDLKSDLILTDIGCGQYFDDNKEFNLKNLLFLMNKNRKLVDIEKKIDRKEYWNEAYYYAPPEIIDSTKNYKIHNNKILKGRHLRYIDKYHVGIISFIMLAGQTPFYGNTNNELFYSIYNNEVNFSKLDLSICCKDFITSLLRKYPRRRARIDTALNHPFITGEDFVAYPWDLEKKIIFPHIFKQTIQSIIPCGADQFAIYNYFHGKKSYWDKQKDDFNGLYIYNYDKHECKASMPLKTEDDKEQSRLIANAAVYNKRTNILTIYEQNTQKLIEYDVKNDSWNTEKYTKRIVQNIKANGISSNEQYVSLKFDNRETEQSVFIDDKIHIFRNTPYKHWVIDDYFKNDAERKEIEGDDATQIQGYRFNPLTEIMYSKLNKCLFVLFNKRLQSELFKYSISDKKWSKIKMNFEYHHQRAILCDRDRFILFYDGYPMQKYEKSRNILIFNVENEEMIKSVIKTPFDDGSSYRGIMINENDDWKVLCLITGFLRSDNVETLNNKDVIDLINSYIAEKWLYLLASNGNICKVVVQSFIKEYFETTSVENEEILGILVQFNKQCKLKKAFITIFATILKDEFSDDIKKYWNKLVDKNKNRLNEDSLKNALIKCGKYSPRNAINAAKKILNHQKTETDHNGSFDLAYFTRLFYRKCLNENEENWINEMFVHFDQNDAGFIVAQDITAIFQQIHKKCDIKEAQAMIDEVSTEKDGKVSLDEFINAMNDC